MDYCLIEHVLQSHCWMSLHLKSNKPNVIKQTLLNNVPSKVMFEHK